MDLVVRVNDGCNLWATGTGDGDPLVLCHGGEGGAWASKQGQPQVVGCTLRPNADPRYQRNNQPDGRLAEPVKALGERD